MDWLDFKEFIKDSIIYILIFFVIFIIVLYVTTFSQIIGPSMDPGLRDRDVVVINKLSRNFKRNDVIIFEYKDTKNLVKRVIGLPGDIVEIKNGLLYVNDIKIDEDYLKKDSNTKILNKKFDVVPENKYIVFGDNRDDSLDSRSIGFIDKDDIKGKVIFKMWPLNRIGFIR